LLGVYVVNIPPSHMTQHVHILHTHTHTHTYPLPPHPPTPPPHTQSGDPTEHPFLLGQEQYVICSVGPVGSLSPPLSTTIPVPFRLNANAARTGKIMSQYLVASAHRIMLAMGGECI